MEYEIYYLCNVLGLIVVILIILFHFINADKENSHSWAKENPEAVAHKENEVHIQEKKKADKGKQKSKNK